MPNGRRADGPHHRSKPGFAILDEQGLPVGEGLETEISAMPVENALCGVTHGRCMMVGDHVEIGQAQSCVIGEIGGFVRAIHELDVADVGRRDDRACGLADVRRAGAHLIDDGPVGTGAAQLLQEKERVAAAHIDAISLGDFVGDVLGGVARHVFHIQLFDLEAEPL